MMAILSAPEAMRYCDGVGALTVRRSPESSAADVLLFSFWGLAKRVVGGAGGAPPAAVG
jgi:hypothetical protein